MKTTHLKMEKVVQVFVTWNFPSHSTLRTTPSSPLATLPHFAPKPPTPFPKSISSSFLKSLFPISPISNGDFSPPLQLLPFLLSPFPTQKTHLQCSHVMFSLCKNFCKAISEIYSCSFMFIQVLSQNYGGNFNRGDRGRGCGAGHCG